jgi:holo-[acyl-carrier protein] synthase
MGNNLYRRGGVVVFIEGIGTDIVSVERIKDISLRNSRFLKRVFTERELAYCFKRKDPYQCLAARFAAKEAVFKSMGTGLSGCRWTDVEVVRSGFSAPIVHLGGNAGKIAGGRGISKVMLSISHERGMAVAFALAVRGDRNEGCDRRGNEGN